MELHFKKKQTDPVCGQKVDPDRSDYTTVYNKHSYYFCSQVCLDRFAQDSGRYEQTTRSGVKGIWSRYLHRVQKATDGKPPCCH
ncbi:MAG: YHS domain-containing protein [Desulfosarcina sp.]|nr:YHS domain-containing protein [Desulfobacterales bacterium]